MSLSALGAPFLGLDLVFMKGLFLRQVGSGQSWGAEPGQGRVEAAFLMPLLFLSSLLSPRLHDCPTGGREGTIWDWVRLSEQPLQYPIYKSSPGEKDWFLAEFYVRLKEKQSKTWFTCSLGYHLFFKNGTGGRSLSL